MYINVLSSFSSTSRVPLSLLFLTSQSFARSPDPTTSLAPSKIKQIVTT